MYPGVHLMIDCYGCPQDKLADVDFIANFLDAFPEKINLNRLSRPQVFKYNGGQADEHGVSGVVLVSESHISVHTFPQKEQVFVDIFSTQSFDTALVAEELVKIFEVTHHQQRVVTGAGELPEDLPHLAGTVNDECYGLAAGSLAVH